ncbi:uncharacterized protein EI90DRAFT_264841 [Cantharellus anzutake]|uniref:uncharacterized protein n=1 Tax=Cantharellus anzutake TaxID=1750568 RepID=UPI001905A9BA|nr:uncharacterized protein EI90DRAFT_264841 [Cantharellus anzutake]KAF8335840.1 hypothetical protein EI90DRAFT_264841 [Cantharellus anzutake]
MLLTPPSLIAFVVVVFLFFLFFLRSDRRCGGGSIGQLNELVGGHQDPSTLAVLAGGVSASLGHLPVTCSGSGRAGRMVCAPTEWRIVQPEPSCMGGCPGGASPSVGRSISLSRVRGLMVAGLGPRTICSFPLHRTIMTVVQIARSIARSSQVNYVFATSKYIFHSIRLIYMNLLFRHPYILEDVVPAQIILR